MKQSCVVILQYNVLRAIIGGCYVGGIKVAQKRKFSFLALLGKASQWIKVWAGSGRMNKSLVGRQ